LEIGANIGERIGHLMDEKKQIDKERWDIAKIMADNFHINGEGFDESDFEWTAHCLQMEGYRKQSRGEWKQAYNSFPRYVCTNCNHLFNNKTFKYCPNCGAKMKGACNENL
jgi:rubrerythrin